MTIREAIEYLEFMKREERLHSFSTEPCKSEIALGMAIDKLKQYDYYEDVESGEIEN